MATIIGRMHWAGRNSGSRQTGDITRAVYLLSEDGAGVVQITMSCDYKSHRYDIKLFNRGDNHFEGAYQKYEIDSRRPVREGRLSCNVLNMTQRHGLVVGTSAWVDDDEFEWDWLANLDSIERVPFEEWCN